MMFDSDRLRKKKNKIKLVSSILFIIFLIITIVLVVLDLEDKSFSLIYPILMPIFIFIDIFCAVFWIFSLIVVKFHTYIYKEYEISFYLGWFCDYLLIDGVIVDKHTEHYFGVRPFEYDYNGEKIFLEIGPFNNYTLKVENKILH